MSADGPGKSELVPTITRNKGVSDLQALFRSGLGEGSASSAKSAPIPIPNADSGTTRDDKTVQQGKYSKLNRSAGDVDTSSYTSSSSNLLVFTPREGYLRLAKSLPPGTEGTEKSESSGRRGPSTY